VRCVCALVPCCSSPTGAVSGVRRGRYENLVQVRCLLEGVQPQDMLDNWHELLPAYMEKWGLKRSEV